MQVQACMRSAPPLASRPLQDSEGFKMLAHGDAEEMRMVRGNNEEEEVNLENSY